MHDNHFTKHLLIKELNKSDNYEQVKKLDVLKIKNYSIIKSLSTKLIRLSSQAVF
jgi:hypothetical protein